MNRKHITAAIAAAAVLVLLAGCAGDTKHAQPTGPQAAPSKVVRIKDKGVTAKGGTVYLLQESDFDFLDPVNTYVTNGQEVGRLIYRTLTFVRDTPGEQPSIQPDLAAELGTPSDGGRTWTFTLRRGLKYEDGSPITAKDVKYGIQRSFATDLYTDGPTYMVDLLVNDNEYAGPYASPEKDLTSVETPDDHTLIFHFQGPQPDANWLMSQPYTAPVPAAKDTRLDYDKRPVASGPYKIESYTPDTSLVLIRNDQWDPSIDPNRPAYPDRFEFTMGIDRATISQRLIKDDGNDRFAATLDPALTNADAAKIGEPNVSPRFITGPGPCIDFIVFNTQQIPDADVRHAIALAINRQGIQAAYGGDLFGSTVDSIIPATLEGFRPPDLGLKPGGDPEAAKRLLAGKKVPPLHFGVAADAVKGRAEATQVQNDLKAVGIDVIIDTYPADTYYSTLHSMLSPALAHSSWCYDWPTPGGIVPAVLGPDADGKTWGSNNYSKYFDPALSAEIQQLASSTEPPATVAANFNDLYNRIQTTAWPLLPTIAVTQPLVVGANLTNAGVSPIYSLIDLNTVAVKQ